jgi:hypothetical protein
LSGNLKIPHGQYNILVQKTAGQAAGMSGASRGPGRRVLQNLPVARCTGDGVFYRGYCVSPKDLRHRKSFAFGLELTIC